MILFFTIIVNDIDNRFLIFNSSDTVIHWSFSFLKNKWLGDELSIRKRWWRREGPKMLLTKEEVWEDKVRSSTDKIKKMEGTWITVTVESDSCPKHCMEARGVYGLGLWILVVEMPKVEEIVEWRCFACY